MQNKYHLSLDELNRQVEAYCKPGTLVYDTREPGKHFTVMCVFREYILMATDYGYYTCFRKFDCLQYIRPAKENAFHPVDYADEVKDAMA